MDRTYTPVIKFLRRRAAGAKEEADDNLAAVYSRAANAVKTGLHKDGGGPTTGSSWMCFLHIGPKIASEIERFVVDNGLQQPSRDDISLDRRSAKAAASSTAKRGRKSAHDDVEEAWVVNFPPASASLASLASAARSGGAARRSGAADADDAYDNHSDGGQAGGDGASWGFNRSKKQQKGAGAKRPRARAAPSAASRYNGEEDEYNGGIADWNFNNDDSGGGGGVQKQKRPKKANAPPRRSGGSDDDSDAEFDVPQMASPAPKGSGSASSSSPGVVSVGSSRFTLGSGSYALVLALAKGGPGWAPGKEELCEVAQRFCREGTVMLPRVRPGGKSSQYYGGWSSMGTLVKKGLVERYGRPASFCLADGDGKAAGRLLLQQHQARQALVLSSSAAGEGAAARFRSDHGGAGYDDEDEGEGGDFDVVGAAAAAGGASVGKQQQLQKKGPSAPSSSSSLVRTSAAKGSPLGALPAPSSAAAALSSRYLSGKYGGGVPGVPASAAPKSAAAGASAAAGRAFPGLSLAGAAALARLSQAQPPASSSSSSAKKSGGGPGATAVAAAAVLPVQVIDLLSDDDVEVGAAGAAGLLLSDDIIDEYEDAGGGAGGEGGSEEEDPELAAALAASRAEIDISASPSAPSFRAPSSLPRAAPSSSNSSAPLSASVRAVKPAAASPAAAAIACINLLDSSDDEEEEGDGGDSDSDVVIEARVGSFSSPLPRNPAAPGSAAAEMRPPSSAPASSTASRPPPSKQQPQPTFSSSSKASPASGLPSSPTAGPYSAAHSPWPALIAEAPGGLWYRRALAGSHPAASAPAAPRASAPAASSPSQRPHYTAPFGNHEGLVHHAPIAGAVVTLHITTNEKPAVRQLLADIYRSACDADPSLRQRVRIAETFLLAGDFIYTATVPQPRSFSSAAPAAGAPAHSPYSSSPASSSASPTLLAAPETLCVLGYVLERKDAADLFISMAQPPTAGSFANRHKRQRHMLLRCGLARANYLVEGDLDDPSAHMRSMYRGNVARSVKTSVAETTVAGFNVIYAEGAEAGLRRLLALAGVIHAETARRTDWALGEHSLQRWVAHVERVDKLTWESVRMRWGAMLLQHYRIQNKAVETILSHFPTPAGLMRAYGAAEAGGPEKGGGVGGKRSRAHAEEDPDPAATRRGALLARLSLPGSAQAVGVAATKGRGPCGGVCGVPSKDLSRGLAQYYWDFDGRG